MFDLTLYLCMLLTVFDIRAQIWRSLSSFIICTGPFIPSRSFFRVFLIRWSWLTSISSTTFASWLGSINNFTSSLCHFQISRSILCRHHLRPAIFQICPNRMGYLWWSVSKQGRVIFEFEIIELKKYLYSKNASTNHIWSTKFLFLSTSIKIHSPKFSGEGKHNQTKSIFQPRDSRPSEFFSVTLP